MACGTRRVTQYGVVPPYKERNAVAQAINLNPKGSHAMAAGQRYGSSPGSHPVVVTVPCPAAIACERNPSLIANRP